MENKSRSVALAAIVLVLLILLCRTTFAGDRQFSVLVDRMSAYCQKRPMRGMGLISFVANRFTPRGVGHLQMAIFEDVPPVRRGSPEEMDAFLAQLAGPDYQPFVRARDNRSGDFSAIYVRTTDDRHFDMLIVAIDANDAVVMKLRLNPDAMRDWMDEPVSHGRDSAHGGAGERR